MQQIGAVSIMSVGPSLSLDVRNAAVSVGLEQLSRRIFSRRNIGVRVFPRATSGRCRTLGGCLGYGTLTKQSKIHAGFVSLREAKMISIALSRTSISAAALTGLLAFPTIGQAKDYLKGERPQQRGYSEAVITEGGRTVWLAGQTATVDDAGKSLGADFEAQVRQLFKNLDRTLQKAGGKLSDMVQMTVFITDVRYGDRLTQIRREVFGDNFPGSALITITALAVPDAKIEIQGYAVIGGK
jgi:2-iminobutanoate/2-iminopropanoate deaminase